LEIESSRCFPAFVLPVDTARPGGVRIFMLKHALVTGASAGLGRELVRQLVLDRGMTVLATARRRDRVEALARELPEGRVLVEAGDLTNAGFRERLWQQAEALPGGLDLLVNNAGLGHYAEFADEDSAIVRHIVELNLMALMDLTQKAIRTMKLRRSGQILQISSVLGEIGQPYDAAYVATKHAVNGLVRSVRYELRGTGVRVWAACPGRTESEFSQVAMGGGTLKGPLPKGESTEKVVRGILRGLDRRSGFIYPTFLARMLTALAHWLPGPFEWWMDRWSSSYFQNEINRARHGSARSRNPSVP
jgi:short-subunit dehydrogenase